LINQHPFFEHIREQHPDPDNFADFIAASQRPLRKSIRVNTLKISVTDFQELAHKRGWLLTTIPWCAEGFWINIGAQGELSQLGNCSEHLMGLFYIQEASSMLPPVALAVDHKTDLVLDLAAAPGSKTTQLAAFMNNQGTILANELSASRLKVLHANLQRCGVTNTCLSHFDGTLMDQNLAGCFNAILLDAPCGGEGTFRKDTKALDNWSLDALETISSLQKQLLISAWKMLKPGGRLVYSTCTLSQAENQDVVNWFKEEIGSELKVIQLDNLFQNAEKVMTEEGYLLIWPERFDCEGFFVACIEKSKSAESDTATLAISQSPFKNLDKKTMQFISEYYQQHFGYDISAITARLRIRNSQREQQIWLFPEHGDQLREALRLQRSGIRICDLIQSRQGPLIKTCHEFVISYGANFTRQFVELNAEQAAACCKGENIQAVNSTDLKKGEVVMAYQELALGLGKVLTIGDKSKIKNNLPRDLLRNNPNFLC